MLKRRVNEVSAKGCMCLRWRKAQFSLHHEGLSEELLSFPLISLLVMVWHFKWWDKSTSWCFKDHKEQFLVLLRDLFFSCFQAAAITSVCVSGLCSWVLQLPQEIRNGCRCWTPFPNGINDLTVTSTAVSEDNELPKSTCVEVGGCFWLGFFLPASLHPSTWDWKGSVLY